MADGEFGLGSGVQPDGGFGRFWYAEPIRQEEITFDADVFLLTKRRAEALSDPAEPEPPPPEPPTTSVAGTGEKPDEPVSPAVAEESKVILQVQGTIPPEVWNRLGIRVLPKLRPLDDLRVGIELSATVSTVRAPSLEAELNQALRELDLGGRVRAVVRGFGPARSPTEGG